MTPQNTTIYTDGNPETNKAIKDIDTIYNATPMENVPDNVKTVSPNTLPDGVVAATEKTYTGKISIILNEGIFPYLLPEQKKQVLIHELAHVEEMVGNKLSNLVDTKNNAQDMLLDKYLHLTESIEARVNYVAKNISEKAGYGKDFLDNAYKAETKYFSGLMSVAAKMPDAANDIYHSITGCGGCNKNGYGG